MIVRWTEKAFLSLEQIGHHVAEDSLEAATRTVQSIYERIEDLAAFPNRLKDSSIEILQIRHGAQNRKRVPV